MANPHEVALLQKIGRPRGPRRRGPQRPHVPRLRYDGFDMASVELAPERLAVDTRNATKGLSGGAGVVML